MGRYLVDEFGDPITKTNPLPVELSGSNVAIPVDIQYNQLTPAEALPVTMTSGNTRKIASDTILFGGATVGAHHAGDILSVAAGEILEFDTGLPAGNSGIILSSQLTLNQDAVFAGGAGYYLYLWNVTQTPIADNAAFVMASLTGYIGRLDIGILVDLGSVCAITDVGHNLDFSLAAADTKLYGMLVCKGTDTTIDNKTMMVNLGIAAI